MDIKNLKLNIEQKVLGKKRVVIVPHKRIDFDAIGSALGLAVIVRKMNAVPIIVVDDNIKEMQRGIQIIMEDVSNDFEIVSRDEYLEMKDDEDVYILTDVNKRGMVSIGDSITDPGRTVIIDHHNMDDTTIESDATYVDEYVSSASEIVARLMCMFKCKSTPEIANYLLAGIYLDTDHMSKNVSNDTFLADYDSIIGDYPIGYLGNNEFTMNCFKDMVDIIALTPYNWKLEVEHKRPHILIVESATLPSIDACTVSTLEPTCAITLLSLSLISS